MMVTSAQPGSHRPLALVGAKVLAGLLLAVLAVALMEAHFSNIVGWTVGAPVMSKPALRTCLRTHECWIIQADETLLLSILALSGVTLMGWIALKKRHRADAQSNGE